MQEMAITLSVRLFVRAYDFWVCVCAFTFP